MCLPSFPCPPNLCTKAVAGNVGKELHLKKKNMALVVLLWASPRVHVSVSVTAWVADDAAVGQGHSQPLPELQSSFSNGGSWRGWGVIKIQHSWVRGILRPSPPEDVLSIVTCLGCLCGDKTWLGLNTAPGKGEAQGCVQLPTPHPPPRNPDPSAALSWDFSGSFHSVTFNYLAARRGRDSVITDLL